MARYCKLIMITGANNNKYYEMFEENGQIKVKYGRVESTATTIYKPLSQWNAIVKEKEKKGYKNVTDLVSVKEDTSSVVIQEEPTVEEIKNKFKLLK